MSCAVEVAVLAPLLSAVAVVKVTHSSCARCTDPESRTAGCALVANFAATRQCTPKGDLVGIFKVSADRQAHG